MPPAPSVLESLSGKVSPEFADLITAALEEPISQQTAERLISTQSQPEIDLLISAAGQLRDRLKGQYITFSKKVFIPLTNLCRDYCGYCTFRRDPGDAGAHTMTPDEVLEVAQKGAELGCKEALFSLGDRPEASFPEMREMLAQLGHRTTLSYLSSMCSRVLRETGLLPHPNPGLMGRADLERLRETSPSMGLMLENASERFSTRGMAHFNAPDKIPSLRLKTIEEAGKLQIPFTTGILIGIGETLKERIEALLAIRELHKRYGHIQEVIIQNFRAKPMIPMRDHPEPSLTDHARTIAVARLLLRDMNVQAPPNLADQDYPYLLRAGINDWGGISPLTKDFINPEKPWPHIGELSRRTEAEGLELRERLSVYPEFVTTRFIASSLLSEVRGLSAKVDAFGNLMPGTRIKATQPVQEGL